MISAEVSGVLSSGDFLKSLLSFCLTAEQGSILIARFLASISKVSEELLQIMISHLHIHSQDRIINLFWSNLKSKSLFENEMSHGRCTCSFRFCNRPHFGVLDFRCLLFACSDMFIRYLHTMTLTDFEVLKQKSLAFHEIDQFFVIVKVCYHKRT